MAKTAVQLPDQTAIVTFTPVLGNGTGWGSASIGVTNLVARYDYQGGYQNEPYEEHEEPEEGKKWVGVYEGFDVDLVYGEETAAMSILVWTGDEQVDDDEEDDEFPDEYVINGSGDAGVTFTLQLLNIFRSASTTEEPPATREFMSYIDRRSEDKWLLDQYSTWAMSATWGDGGSLSLSGGFDEDMRGEYDDLPCGIALSYYPNKCHADTDQWIISNWSYSGTAVDMSLAHLHKPGTGTPPDPDGNPTWTRTTNVANHLHFENGTLGIVGELPLWTISDGLTLEIFLPVHVTFRERVGKHADDVAYGGMQVTGPCGEWAEDPPGTWNWAPVAFGDGKTVTEQRRSWLFEYEWRNLLSHNMQITTDSDWATANAEAGESCPLLLHPINVATLGGYPPDTWPALATLSHAGQLPVVKPSGVSRPADWTGSNGVTVDGGNNDLWHVAEGSSGPSVSLTLATRKWARLDRLEEHTADEDFKRADLTILNHPNYQETWPDTGLYIDPPAGRDPENEWYWKQYTWLRLSINAPRDATLVVTVNYSTITVFDPRYTCFEHTYGTSGEYTYTRYPHTATYNVSVDETPDGQAWSSAYIDLMVPRTETAVPDMYHVDSITISLPSTGDAEDWHLDDIYLAPDVDATRRPLYKVRCYDPANSESDPGDPEAVPPVPITYGDYTMVAFFVEGRRSTEIPYGMEQYQKREMSFKGRQIDRHCPNYVGVGAGQYRDHAKVFSRFPLEVGWQRGWSCTDNGVDESNANKDATGTKMLLELYWFDLLRSHEADISASGTDYDWPGSPITIRWKIVGGVHYTVYYECFLQGRAEGMVVKADRTGRSRGIGNLTLQRQATGTSTWSDIATGVPDIHGRFRIGPVLQEGYTYRIADVGDFWVLVSRSHVPTNTQPFAIWNKRYSSVDLVGGTGLAESAIDVDWGGGFVHRVAIDDDGQLVAQRLAWPFEDNAWSDTVSMDPGRSTVLDDAGACTRPTIECLGDGRFYVAYERDSALVQAFSNDGLQTLVAAA